MAAACTEKEIDQVTPQNDSQNESGTVTFTATIPATKGYNTIGEVRWEEGDIIRIAANTECPTWEEHGSYALNDYSHLVILTDENIFEEGKKAVFSVDGLPNDAANYYAVAFTPNVPYPNFNSTGTVNQFVGSMMSNSDFECKVPNSTANGLAPHISCASCTPADTKLTFTNVGTILKFSTRRSDICHVDFYGNEVNPVTSWIHKISTNARGYSWASPGKQVCFLGENNTVDGGPGDYYFLLAPGQTFTGGITLYAFDNWKGLDNEGVLIGKIVVRDDFVTQAGDFWDLGYIEDHFTYDTYKEAYDAGQTIKVGDLEVNKATFGASQLITSDSRFYPASGVAFVDPSAVNANLQFWSGTPKCIVIGNDPQQRSNLEIRAQGNFQDGQVVAFKNLNIKLGDGFSNPWMAKTNNGDVLDWFAIDNCRVDFQTRLVELPNNGINNFSITDSDIVVLDGSGPNDVHRAIICRGTESEYVGTRLVFRNNLVTTESTTAKGFCLINNDATKLSFSTVDISFNTIHNVQNAGYYFVSLANIGTSVTMTKNLLWKGGSFNWIQLYGLADGASASFDYAGVTDNKLEGWILRAKNGDAIVATGTAGWYQQKDENYPFEEVDLATVISTRNYTVIPALAGYGVTDPKRLQ